MTKSVYKFTFVLFFSLSLTQLRGRTGINYHKKSVFKLVWLFCREREYFFWNEPEQFYRRDALPSTTVEEMAFLLVYAAHSTGANSQERGIVVPFVSCSISSINFVIAAHLSNFTAFTLFFFPLKK